MSATGPPASPERGRHPRQVFSLPFSLRSSSKKTSVKSLQEQVNCMEGVDYPVFDPKDPSHAPSVHVQARRGHEMQTSSSESQKLTHRIHDLPMRSLHKARSGLIALGAGLFRRSARQSTNQADETSSLPPEGEHEHGHECAAVPPSEVSTEEDSSFGYELTRESGSWSASFGNHGPASVITDSMITVASVHTLNAVIAAAAPADQDSRQYYLEPRVYVPEGTSVDDECRRGRPLKRRGSECEVENEQSAKHEQEMTDLSVGSFTLPDPDALSTLSSNASGGREFRVAQSEAFATQEQLQLPRSSVDSEERVQTGEISRRGSSEVIQFAFPGIYQALVEQWLEDTRGGAQVPGSEGTVTINAPPCAESKPSVQTPPTAHLSSLRNITSPSERHAHPEASGSSTSSAAYERQAALDEAGFPVDVSGHYGASESAQTPVQLPERRHSFGIHISLRNASDSGNRFNEPSHQPYTADDGYSSSVGLGGILGSLCDESDFSAGYTQGGTTSAEITSPTSISGSVWSPLDSPIDEEVYFPASRRNEFYMGDGKASGHHPDRGDLPVKAARRALGDGGIYSGFGLDRAPSYRAREMAEMRPQGTIQQAQSARRTVMQSEESESADSTLGHQAHPGHLH